MYKLLLEKNGYVENIDFKSVNGVITAIDKTHMVNYPIVHPEIPEERNAAGEISFLKVPEWLEDNFVEEVYTPTLPTELELIVKEGQESKEKCQRALNLIYGYNKVKTPEQIQAMMVSFAEINTLLLNSWTSAALNRINAVIPDGVIVTQPMKDMLIEVLS